MLKKNKRRVLSALIALLLMLCMFMSAHADTGNEMEENVELIEETLVVTDEGTEEEEQVITSEDVTDPPQVQEPPKEPEKKPESLPDIEPATYTVRFFDYNGDEFYLLEGLVVEGERIEVPIWIPMHDDMVFLYWFNEKDDLKAPFNFEQEYVYKDINLIAMFEAIVIQGNDDYEEESQFSDFYQDPDVTKQGKPKDNGFIDDPDGLLLAGTVIEDDSLKGTVVDYRSEGDLIVAIINIDEVKENGDDTEQTSNDNQSDGNEEASEEDDLNDQIEEASEEDNLNDQIEEASEEDDPNDGIEEASEGDNLNDQIEEVSEEDDPNDGIEENSEDNEDEKEEDEKGGLDNSNVGVGDEAIDDGEVNGSVVATLQEKPFYQLGDLITLNGYVEGFVDAIDLVYQWEYSLDGENWTAQEGATALDYSFTLTEENAKYMWRLTVAGMIPGPDPLVQELVDAGAE